MYLQLIISIFFITRTCYCIIGSIPKSIDIIGDLRALMLQRNCLTGSIPSTIGNLLNLTVLNLYSNKFNGMLRIVSYFTFCFWITCISGIIYCTCIV